MYTNMEFSNVETEERIDFTIDFVNDVSEDEVLVDGQVTFLIEVVKGTDADPTSHFVGLPSVELSPESGRVTAAVQRIDGLLNNVKYRITAIVETSRGQILELYSHVQCKPRS